MAAARAAMTILSHEITNVDRLPRDRDVNAWVWCGAVLIGTAARRASRALPHAALSRLRLHASSSPVCWSRCTLEAWSRLRNGFEGPEDADDLRDRHGSGVQSGVMALFSFFGTWRAVVRVMAAFAPRRSPSKPAVDGGQLFHGIDAETLLGALFPAVGADVSSDVCTHDRLPQTLVAICAADGRSGDVVFVFFAALGSSVADVASRAHVGRNGKEVTTEPYTALIASVRHANLSASIHAVVYGPRQRLDRRCSSWRRPGV